MPRLFILAAIALPALAATADPDIERLVSDISSDRIAETVRHLAAFETRGNFTDPSLPNRGIGAARRWISDRFKSFSPRLEVSFDPYRVKKQGTRILREVEVVNVIAVLPGATHPEKQIVIGGHYDSYNIVRKPGAPEFTPEGYESSPDDVLDFERSVDAPAPGATDDASGAAVVLELARVMSQHRFDKTIVFIAFAGEEIGLIGSSLYADKAHTRKDQIEAMFNNDVVGNDRADDGRANSLAVNVFSEEPADSPSRELARYIAEAARLYVPAFKAQPVFRADRFSRGGDHSPFEAAGYAAVRFTTPVENLAIQHTAKDTPDKASPSYIANVARVNAAAAASLARAPASPLTTREITTGAAKGRTSPTLLRGASKYDAVLRWRDPMPPATLAGYAIVSRATTAPFWEHELFVGKVTEYTFKQTGIDDVILGVKAIDTQGHESLVAPWIAPPYPRKPIELAQ